MDYWYGDVFGVRHIRGVFRPILILNISDLTSIFVKNCNGQSLSYA